MTAARPSSDREPAPSSRASFVALDALRGVAIVAVVGVHVTFGFLHAAPPGSTAMWSTLVLHLLTTFATPLFVAVSMASLALGYERPIALGAEYATFLLRRARRVLPAYVLWTILTLLRNDPASLLNGGVVGHLLRGSAAYHLYFVPLIVTYYVFWPLLSRLAAAAHRDRRSAGVIAAAGLAASVLAWRMLPATSVTRPLFWLGYATLGLAAAPWLARAAADPATRPAPRGAIAALVVVSALVMVRHVAGLLAPVPDDTSLVLAATIFQLPMLAYTLATMGLATALVVRAPRSGGALTGLGGRSYGIYLAHVLVLEVVVQRLLGRPAAADFGSSAWVAALLAQWLLCLGITWGLIAGLARIPLLAPFAGGRPTERALTAPPPSP